MASIQGQAGENSERVQTINLALKESEQFKNSPKRVESLLLIGKAQIESSMNDGVENTVQNILRAIQTGRKENPEYFKDSSPEYVGINVLTAISRKYAETGNIEKAKLFLRKAEANIENLSLNNKKLDSALRDIAIAEAEIGDQTAAQNTLDKIYALREKSESDEYITKILNIIDTVYLVEAFREGKRPEAAKDYIKKALKLIQPLEENRQELDKLPGFPNPWHLAIHNLAIAQAELGDVESGIRWANTISQRFLKDQALEFIAQAQLNAGDIDGALSTTTGGSDTLSKISIAQAEKGDIKGALQTFENLTENKKEPELFVQWKYFPVLKAIAKGIVKSEGTDKALDWANNQKSSPSRIYAMLGVAEGITNNAKILK